MAPDAARPAGLAHTLRHKAQAILREAGWELPPPPCIGSPPMGPLCRRDRPWPQQVCGMNCHDPEQMSLGAPS